MIHHTQIKTEICFLSDVETAIINALSDGWSVIAMWDIRAAEHGDNDIIKTVITFGKMPLISMPVPEML